MSGFRLGWYEDASCPYCGISIEDDYLKEGENEYECYCGHTIIIHKQSQILYKVEAKTSFYKEKI